MDILCSIGRRGADYNDCKSTFAYISDKMCVLVEDQEGEMVNQTFK